MLKKVLIDRKKTKFKNNKTVVEKIRKTVMKQQLTTFVKERQAKKIMQQKVSKGWRKPIVKRET